MGMKISRGFSSIRSEVSIILESFFFFYFTVVVVFFFLRCYLFMRKRAQAGEGAEGGGKETP